MFNFPQKHYLCNSGEVKKRAEAHRAIFTKLRHDLFDIVASVGATKCHIQDSMMLLQGIIFDDDAPDGWTKNNKKMGSRPKNIEANKEILKHFTPGRSYSIKTHSELAVFLQWLGCPMSYLYSKGEHHSGSHSIGRIFADSILYWYSVDGPILAVLPDVALARKQSVENGEAVVGNVLDWKPCKGLKEIMPEEWDLMKAKHKRMKANNETKKDES